MNILLAFAPFLAFAVVDRLAGMIPGLISGAAVSTALVVRDLISRHRKIKVLEIGSLLLFVGLTVCAYFEATKWSVLGVRLRVDIGLLAIVIFSMLIRQPFTIQYAREKVPRESWSHPLFIRTNYIITGVWAAAFAIIIIADLIMLYMPQVPLRFGIWITILAIFGAYRFTAWYPDRKT